MGRLPLSGHRICVNPRFLPFRPNARAWYNRRSCDDGRRERSRASEAAREGDEPEL
jgi:hypothetical protein